MSNKNTFQGSGDTKKEWILNLMAFMGSSLFLLLLLLLLEFFVRIWGAVSFGGQEAFLLHWMRDSKQVGVYQPDPGVINRLGFHSREIPIQKKTNTLRILVLGGSAVYGWNAIETSWTWYLEKNLQKRFPQRNVEVINGGISGGRSLESYRLLTETIHLKPDIVMVYDGWNDIYSGHYCPEWFKSSYNDIFEDSRENSVLNKLDRILETHSYLYHITLKSFYDFRKRLKRKAADEKNAQLSAEERKNLTGDPAAFKKEEQSVGENNTVHIRCEDETLYQLRPEGEVPDNFSMIYRQSLEAMAALSKKSGAAFLAFLQPSLAYSMSQGKTPHEAEDILRKANGVFYEDFLNASKRLYPEAQKVIQSLNAKGTPAYDLTGVLEGQNALYFVDAVHYRDPEALNLIAKAVEKKLDENHLL